MGVCSSVPDPGRGCCLTPAELLQCSCWWGCAVNAICEVAFGIQSNKKGRDVLKLFVMTYKSV